MEDGDADDTNATALAMNPNSNNKVHPHEEALDRPRSGSAASTTSSNHRRTLSGSLLSKLSFLRTSNPDQAHMQPGRRKPAAVDGCVGRDDGDGDGAEGDNDVPVSAGSTSAAPGAGLRGGSKAMASALQQQRRTRKRRGSLRKTALLGTRLESKKMNRAGYNTNNDNGTNNINGGDDETGGQQQQQLHALRDTSMRSFGGAEDGTSTFELGGRDNSTNLRRGYAQQQQKKPLRGTRHESDILGDETGTDDETNAIASTAATNLQRNYLGTPSSSADSYFALQTAADPTTATVHRTKSPLAHHHHHHLLHHHNTTEIKTANHHQEISWDYSETESWGWIILIVTWLVFVVGMGSCFGVWSWAWDVGETPYAPPELEDDPSLPIVGYYPALIILTAVMSWVWVVVAWVGMKYFKHANISGEEI